MLQVAAVDAGEGVVFFTGHDDRARPYDTHIYRVGLDGTGFRRLTKEQGQHSPSFSPSRRFFLDTHSSHERPPRVDLRTADGSLVRTVSTADVSALEDLEWRPPEELTTRAADGKTELWGMLYVPWNFDPAKSYPVLDYIYNGPQTVQVPKTFTGGVLPQAMAQLGFVVFVVDGRGTTERGKAFQDVVYRRFGQNEIPTIAPLSSTSRVPARSSTSSVSASSEDRGAAT